MLRRGGAGIETDCCANLNSPALITWTHNIDSSRSTVDPRMHSYDGRYATCHGAMVPVHAFRPLPGRTNGWPSVDKVRTFAKVARGHAHTCLDRESGSCGCRRTCSQESAHFFLSAANTYGMCSIVSGRSVPCLMSAACEGARHNIKAMREERSRVIVECMVSRQRSSAWGVRRRVRQHARRHVR